MGEGGHRRRQGTSTIGVRTCDTLHPIEIVVTVKGGVAEGIGLSQLVACPIVGERFDGVVGWITVHVRSYNLREVPQ